MGPRIWDFGSNNLLPSFSASPPSSPFPRLLQLSFPHNLLPHIPHVDRIHKLRPVSRVLPQLAEYLLGLE